MNMEVIDFSRLIN